MNHFRLILFFLPIYLTAQSLPFENKVVPAHLLTSAGNWGTAVVDFDNDGWDDIFVSNIPYVYNGNDTSHCLLFRNNHDETFSNVTKQTGLWLYGGYKTCLWADVNNDGYPDLFMGTADGQGYSHLFISNKNGTFKDVIATCGIDSAVLVSGAAFGDYNGDGKIDLILATEGSVNILMYRNVSTKDSVKFIEASQQCNITKKDIVTPMQVTFIDYDHDGYLDIYKVHDGRSPSLLFRNRGDGTFVDVSVNTGLDDVGVGNCMGVYWADFDGDGWEDVYVTRIRKGGLYLRQHDETYKNVAAALGAEKNGMSWGIVCEDFDNDGDLDMFIVNSYGFDQTKSIYFENNDGLYTDKAPEYRIDFPKDFYGVTCADFNNDGYLDIFAPAIDGENKFLINTRAKHGNWVKIKLRGVTVNTMAIGTRVHIAAGGKNFIRTVTAGNGYLSQGSQVLHFGLGAATVIDTLEIFWKKNYVQQFTKLNVNTTCSITEGENSVLSTQSAATITTPSHFLLEQNYPNPFNPSTVIGYQLPISNLVTLKLFDVLGREVATLVNEQQQAGSYHVQVSLGQYQLSSGVYFYQLRAGEYSEIKKMMVLQ